VSSDLSFLTVVTYGRTGSTAIQASLNALPGVLVRGENYGAIRGLATYTRAVAAAADRHHAGRPDHPWFGTAKLDATQVVSDVRRHVLANLLRPRTGTSWIGFKEVRYEPGHFADYEQLLDYLLFLNSLFPGIRYVFNVRDENETAKSGWWPNNPHAVDVLRTTREWLEHASAELSCLMPGHQRTCLLRYEEWADDPHALIRAFADLGLPRDDDAVRAALGERLGHGKSSRTPS